MRSAFNIDRCELFIVDISIVYDTCIPVKLSNNAGFEL